MSTITNRVATVFTASAGNVKAVMGEISGGMLNIGRAAMQTGQRTGYLSNQLKAMSTTLRYAIAGTAVFGTAGLIRGLSQMQTQLALMSTLSDAVEVSTRTMVTSGQGLRGIMDQMQQASLAALTPVQDLNAAAINLLSSVQGIAGTDIAPITTSLAQGAQLAQAPVEDLTKAVTGMNQAFGRAPTRGNFEGLTRGFITLTRRAPGGAAAGAQIINQLAPLAAVSRLAHVSPQQMFGLLTTSMRFGGTPATSARGLQFLLQSIATPNKAEAKVLAGVGITPDFVQRFGGVAALQRLVAAMRTRGVRGGAALKGLPDEVLDAADVAGMEGLKGLGVSGAGVELAHAAVGRIHGVRSLITLLNEMNAQDPLGMSVFAQDIHQADLAILGLEEPGRAVADQFADFARQQPLRAAAIALHNMTMEIPRAFEGVLNAITRPIAERVAPFILRHPKETRRGVQIAGGVALGAALVQLLSRGRFLPFLKGGVGRAFVTERAIEAATDPRQVGILGGSPQNPMYVTVVGQLFGGGGGGRGGKGGGVVDELEKDLPWFLLFGNKFRRAGRAIPKFLMRHPRATVAASSLGAAAGAEAVYETVFGGLFGGGGRRTNFQRGPLLTRAGEMFPQGNRLDPRWLIVRQYQQGKINERQAEIQLKAAFAQADRLEKLNRILAPFHRRDPLYGVTAIYSQRREMLHGKAVVTLDVNLMTQKGQKATKVHIPVNLWPNANGSSPSQRGQPGRTKGNIP
jgi:hypothetical protein